VLDDGPIFIFVSPCVDGCKLAYLDLREVVWFVLAETGSYFLLDSVTCVVVDG
jgi:hypothetical protein